MKKNFKRFFTLKHKANDGFTLVELIVVIAILAILGGVAVPAYSGYIKKAERAADEELLASLNTAFASACMINGESNYGRTVNKPTITLTGDVGNRVVARDALDANDTEINAAFAGFFEGGTFKVFDELFYNPTLGMFAENAAVSFTFGDTTITLSAEDIAILSGDNAFSDRGSAALLADIGILQTYLAGGFIGSEILTDIGKTAEFTSALGSYLGLNEAEYENEDDFSEAIAEKLDTMDESAMTNALIMYSASHAANASQAQIDKLFSGSVTGNIAVTNGGVRDNEATMANAAIAYGMYTAYAQRTGLDTTQPGNDFVNVVGTTEFKTYIANDEGKADLEAYMAAMNMISNNTSNPAVTGSILQNGITGNTELESLMQEVMGN